MLAVTWSLTRPAGMRAGQETIAGIRRPPSSSSVFLPVKGQVSAKRSPPLSLVKMTIVSSRDALSSQRLQHAPDLRVHRLDHAAVGLLRAAVPVDQVATAQALGLGLVARALPTASAGALKCRLSRNGRPALA